MYTVRLNFDKNLIHDPSIGLFLTNPHLVMEENCAGSFEFDMPPDHPQINAVKRLKCEISVYRDGEEIWAGRPVEETTNFYGVKHVYCEGLLSALFDTTQPPSERHDISVIDFMDAMLKIHNSQITPTYRWRPFFRSGIVTVKENLYRYTNFEETLTCINEKLVKRLGGHLRMRRKNGNDPFNFLLDYLEDYPTQSTQVIRFGQNLLDYSKNFDASGLATVVVPLGARQEEKDIEALEKYLDVASVNGGSIYVQDDALVELYGKIVKVVHWDDITTAKELLKKAKLYLSEMQYENMQLEVKAVDFHLADENVPAINLLDEIRVVSTPHGLDKFFPVTKLDIQLDQPENTIITLGTVVKTSLTTQTNDRNNEIKTLVDSYVPPSEILTQAKNQATQLIESGALGGHVVVLPNEIYISDSDDISVAEKQWRWNLKGLGYRASKKDGFGLAMTMDGSIVADYITSGLMSADRIRGGSLKLGGGSYKNGILYMYDADGVEIGRWSKGGLIVKKGTITGSTITVGGQGNASGRLRIVDENNALIGWWDNTGLGVKKGSISGGTIIGTTITVGGKNNGDGRLRIVDSAKKVIGWWDNTGIHVKSGNISGTSMQVGGENNEDGVFTVHDAKGKEIGKWDRNGLKVSQGEIRGVSVIVGGDKNTDGTFQVLNEEGTVIGKWDKDGLNVTTGTIRGSTISGGSITGASISSGIINGTEIHLKGNKAKIFFHDTGFMEDVTGGITKDGIYLGASLEEVEDLEDMLRSVTINLTKGIELDEVPLVVQSGAFLPLGDVYKIKIEDKKITFSLNNTKWELGHELTYDPTSTDMFQYSDVLSLKSSKMFKVDCSGVFLDVGKIIVKNGNNYYKGYNGTFTISSRTFAVKDGLIVTEIETSGF